jgi:hypothetical protein
MIALSLSGTKDFFQALQAGLTSAAIVIGGVWWITRRRWYPRCRIEHEIRIRHLSPTRSLVRVHVALTNEGDRLIRLKSGFTSIQQIIPCDGEIITSIESLPHELATNVQEMSWPTLAKRPIYGIGDATREIESGEKDFVEQDFVIARRVGCILVYTYVTNEWKGTRGWVFRKPRNMGWSRCTICDVTDAGGGADGEE